MRFSWKSSFHTRAEGIFLELFSTFKRLYLVHATIYVFLKKNIQRRVFLGNLLLKILNKQLGFCHFYKFFNFWNRLKERPCFEMELVNYNILQSKLFINPFSLKLAQFYIIYFSKIYLTLLVLKIHLNSEARKHCEEAFFIFVSRTAIGGLQWIWNARNIFPG